MFQEILGYTLFGNRILDYAIALSIITIGSLGVHLFKNVILNHLKTWVEKTSFHLDKILLNNIERNLVPMLHLGVIYLGIQSLKLGLSLYKVLNFTGVILLTFFGVRFLMEVVNYALRKYVFNNGPNPSREKTLQSVLPIINILVWTVGLVFLLDNLGFKVSAVIASLGIGGVAVALAAQTILRDLFSYVAIVLDNPFEIGDFIIIGDFNGTVEHVGLKTTRIRSLSGEQLIFSNTDLTDSRVRNFKRMEQRRIAFQFGVIYETPTDKLAAIPAMVRHIIEGIPDTLFDRAHFFSYGDFGLNFEVVYHVLDQDYNKYMDVQQTINLNLKKAFEEHGIVFAYPTQTLYLHSENTPK